MYRLAPVLLVVFSASPSHAEPHRLARLDGALTRGARFLLAAQSGDGAWRSQAYPAFADGYSLGPLIMSALLFSPPSPGLRTAYDRGADFIAGLVDAEPTYPVYGLAGAILVLSVPSNIRHQPGRSRLVKRLRARQLNEVLGWIETDESYGGWGYYPRLPKKPPAGAFRHELLSSNLSSTLFAVGALAMAEVSLDDPAFIGARTFIERCQNYATSPDARFDDGGFFFTPANDVQNKAMSAGTDRRGRKRFRSYGSMTADGLRALIRVGVPRTDPRVQAAARWLTRRFDANRASGDYPSDRQLQRDSVYYYYAWTTAHALTALGNNRISTDKGIVRWDFALADAVGKRQSKDGAWRNHATDLREDDPLLATPLAMAALALARMSMTGKWRMAFDVPQD